MLITPHLSQVRWADKILLLRRGELVDVGSHEQMLVLPAEAASAASRVATTHGSGASPTRDEDRGLIPARRTMVVGGEQAGVSARDQQYVDRTGDEGARS